MINEQKTRELSSARGQEFSLEGHLVSGNQDIGLVRLKGLVLVVGANSELIGGARRKIVNGDGRLVGTDLHHFSVGGSGDVGDVPVGHRAVVVLARSIIRLRAIVAAAVSGARRVVVRVLVPGQGHIVRSDVSRVDGRRAGNFIAHRRNDDEEEQEDSEEQRKQTDQDVAASITARGSSLGTIHAVASSQ